MTVCLGILCPSEAAVVVTADRMVTGGRPAVEFEHEGSKIEKLAPNCVAMTAGNALGTRQLFRAVRARIATQQAESIATITEITKEVFVEHRLQLAEDQLLRGRGVTVGEFYEHYLDAWPKELVMGLDQAIQDTTIGIDVLIAGVDDESHLYLIEGQGVQSCWDSLGFCAIGSGTSLATLQWIARCSGPAPSLREAVYVAHEAKFRAEAHPGVGCDTDMVLVTRRGWHDLPDEHVAAMRTQQATVASQPMPGLDEIGEALRSVLAVEEVDGHGN